MKLNNVELVELLHSIQLREVNLVKVECNKKSGLRGLPNEKVSVNLSFESGNIKMDYKAKKGTSFLEAIMIAEDRFDLKVRYEGDFEIIGEATEEQFGYFLNIQAIPMLLGYARETMDMLLLKMNEEGARLPIIDVRELFNHCSESDDDE